MGSIDAFAWADRIDEIDGLIVDGAKPPVADLGPWVTVSEGGAAGYLDVARPLLADVSADGLNEVVLPLRSVAGQPPSGVVVFAPGEDGPRVVGDKHFYTSFGQDTRASIENNELVVRHFVGAGWEPACCWSGDVTRRFRIVGDRLLETAPPLESGNPMAMGYTVDRFYSFINQRNYDAALALLSTSERARFNLSQWPALFAQADQVSVSILSTPRADGLLAYRLVLNSGGLFQSWQGGAAMLYNPPTHSWLIDLLSLQPEQV